MHMKHKRENTIFYIPDIQQHRHSPNKDKQLENLELLRKQSSDRS